MSQALFNSDVSNKTQQRILKHKEAGQIKRQWVFQGHNRVYRV